MYNAETDYQISLMLTSFSLLTEKLYVTGERLSFVEFSEGYTKARSKKLCSPTPTEKTTSQYYLANQTDNSVLIFHKAVRIRGRTPQHHCVFRY